MLGGSGNPVPGEASLAHASVQNSLEDRAVSNSVSMSNEEVTHPRGEVKTTSQSASHRRQFF